jgi:hypothetical protein
MRGLEDTSVLGVGLQSGVGQVGIGYLGVRGEGLNTDGLSLDLQFAADKTLTARKGPTPVLTRANATATFIGSDGLIQTAIANQARFDHDPIGLTNLLSYSNDFNNAVWGAINEFPVRSQNQTDPYGVVNNAWTLDDQFLYNDGAAIDQTFSISPSSTRNYTFSVFAKQGTAEYFDIYSFFQTTTKGSYVRYTWATDQFAAGSADGGGVVPTNIVKTSFGNGWYRFSFTVNDANEGNNISLCYRLYPSGRDANKTGTTIFYGNQVEFGSTVTNYIPTTSNPVTVRDCKGLLLEEQRTNLVFPSAALTTQTRTVTAVAHTLSFYGTGTIVLSGVHVATVTGTGAYPTRTTLTFTPTAGSLILTVTGSVTQAQLEAGAFVTSYIPTTTGSAVRSADACSITGANFTAMYNQTEGSVLVGASTVTSGTRDLVSIDSNGYTENITLFTGSNSAQLSVVDSGAFQVSISSGSPIASNVAFKLACAYKLNDFALTKNGVAPQTDNTGTLPTPNQLKIGYEKGQYVLCGHVASLRYYKKRLPNDKLQSLTA